LISSALNCQLRHELLVVDRLEGILETQLREQDAQEVFLPDRGISWNGAVALCCESDCVDSHDYSFASSFDFE
jgi:hypothetical protein